MDTRTGAITYRDPRQVAITPGQPDHLTPMRQPPTPRQLRTGKVGRNEPCPCGSGRKFKRCHYTGPRRHR